MIKENSALLKSIKILSQQETHHPESDTSIIQFADELLFAAIDKKASDIHCEPYEKNYRIRFRIDGILYEITQLPTVLAYRITSRFKVMAKLDISEKRIPQDGRFKIKLYPKQLDFRLGASRNEQVSEERNNAENSRAKSIDFRINSCPTTSGEKIVIRLLDSSPLYTALNKLGLNETQLSLLLTAIQQPQGMILVTGPTGSGKTVTLYSVLNTLNTIEKNISTAEDPVEIYLHGINQVEINTKVGLTFATALRAFLRQDPDILMIGEMRDLETAEIAIQAAQTGHLVLSTLHTNDAIETLTRLINMGISKLDIATSVSLIVAQRLARRLCDHCKIPETTFHDQDINIYQASGCKLCLHGYNGRIGLFELLPITHSLKELILSECHVSQLSTVSQNAGMMNLYNAGLEKVKAGITSFSEINRVLKNQCVQP